MWQIVPPLALAIATTAIALLLRRTRWAAQSLFASRVAYTLLIASPFVYFPAKVGFRLTALKCEWTFDSALAVHSLTNYAHIVMFTFFFLLTYAQLPNVRRALAWSAAACFAMGLVVELAQGATGAGNCRMRDLIPDSVGAFVGAIVVLSGRELHRLWRRGKG